MTLQQLRALPAHPIIHSTSPIAMLPVSEYGTGTTHGRHIRDIYLCTALKRLEEKAADRDIPTETVGDLLNSAETGQYQIDIDALADIDAAVASA